MRIILGFLVFSVLWLSQGIAGNTVVIAAFGDSLTAGFGVEPADAFPVQLQQEFIRDTYTGAKIIDEGVSGDTTADGLERVMKIVLKHPDLVIIELGTNDLLRKVPPAETRKNLDAIMNRFKRAGIKMLLAGVKASPETAGADYAENFNAIFPELAKEYGAIYYPNFLDGASGIMGLMQPDGIHPTRDGVAVVAAKIAATIEYDLVILSKQELVK